MRKFISVASEEDSEVVMLKFELRLRKDGVIGLWATQVGGTENGLGQVVAEIRLLASGHVAIVEV